jgi:hypothetical protein
MKTAIPSTDTPTNKERLLTACAAYNRQDDDHVHRFRNGLIAHMDIQNVDASPR